MTKTSTKIKVKTENIKRKIIKKIIMNTIVKNTKITLAWKIKTAQFQLMQQQ